MTALHLAGTHAMMADLTRDFQACILIARRSPDRSRGDYQNDHHRRSIKNKNKLIFDERDNVKAPESRFTLTELGAVAEFERARLLKAKLPSRGRRFSVRLSQLQIGIIPALREASQMENISSAKNGERHVS
jgi:hypothetical protein